MEDSNDSSGTIIVTSATTPEQQEHEDDNCNSNGQENVNDVSYNNIGLNSTKKRLFSDQEDIMIAREEQYYQQQIHLYCSSTSESIASSSFDFDDDHDDNEEEEDDHGDEDDFGSQHSNCSKDNDHLIVAEKTSPTSVAIVMGMEGAEVALQDISTTTTNDSSSLFPNNENDPFQAVRSSSLLDVEKTPQRPRFTMVESTVSSSERSASAAAAAGAASASASFDTPTGEGYGDIGPMSIERTITCYLEDPTTQLQFHTSCTDWQFFFFGGYCGGSNSNGVFPSPSSTTPNDPTVVVPSPSKETVRSVLRGSASHSLRARKVRQLRKDIAPFHNSPARSPAKAPSLFRNRSFSISDHRSAIVRVSKDSESTNMMRSSFSDVFQQLCTMPEHAMLETPEISRKTAHSIFFYDNSEDMGYDSDPEDFTRRRQQQNHPHLLQKTTLFTEEGSRSEGAHNARVMMPWSSNFVTTTFTPTATQPIFGSDNDEMFATIVQEIFNQTRTLVFHPQSSSNSTLQQQHNSSLLSSDNNATTATTTKPQHLSRPVAVDAWLERGQHLSYSVLQPKWMWKEKGNGSNKNMQMQMADLQGVELLDVTRILKVEDYYHVADEESCSRLVPFAKPSHCFVIKSIHDDELVFETKSVEERDRLVYSLKVVIARFGAKVLVGDPTVYYEFFSLTDGVPGDAPQLYDMMMFDDEDNTTTKLAATTDHHAYHHPMDHQYRQ